MKTAEWLALAGPVIGALIGLTGVYLAFRLTAKRDDKKALDERTGESVADLAKAATQLSMDLQYTFCDTKRRAALFAFIGSVYVFAAREMREHPTIARWVVMKLNDEYLQAIDFPIKWVPLILRPQLMPKTITAALGMSQQLISWRAGDVSEEWFTKDLDRLKAEHAGRK